MYILPSEISSHKCHRSLGIFSVSYGLASQRYDCIKNLPLIGLDKTIVKSTQSPIFLFSLSYERVSVSAEFLLKGTKHRPKIAIICGSGLGILSQTLVVIQDIKSFVDLNSNEKKNLTHLFIE